MTRLRAEPLTAEAFAPFGEVLEAVGAPDKLINQGMCGRWHDRAALDFSDGRAGISLFRAEARATPLQVEMVERHPDGAQAFIPMSDAPWLVIVAPDEDGAPGPLRAFRPSAGQGVSYRRAVWHGVLAPLRGPALFAVIDRIGPGPNLDEHWFNEPILVDP